MTGSLLRQKLLVLLVMMSCCTCAFSQDSYYMSRAKDYMRDAELHT